MKYIRTKDGIYKAAEINGMIVARGGVAYSCNIADVHFPIVFKEKDITSRATTVEDLCDEFVAIGYGISKKPMVVNYNKFELVKSMSKECEIYGAIWTEWGLKYVAKMNDKGELELL